MLEPNLHIITSQRLRETRAATPSKVYWDPPLVPFCKRQLSAT